MRRRFRLRHGRICKNTIRQPNPLRGVRWKPRYVPIDRRGGPHVIDLSEPIDLGKKFDWVLSLEVGEHLPKKFERIFIENLDRHNLRGIVLSWDLKGQGGYGHFNEQSNEYIKSVMATYGYANDIAAESRLREKCSFLPLVQKHDHGRPKVLN